MTLLKICVVLLVLSVAVPQSNATSKDCGPALDVALDLICVNGFNTKFKKSMEWDDLGINAVEDAEVFPHDKFPFLAAIKGGPINTLTKTRRYRDALAQKVKSGVYDECCNRPCTYNEILSYCRPLEAI